MSSKRFLTLTLSVLIIFLMLPYVSVQADDLYDTVLASNITEHTRYLNPFDCLEVTADDDIIDTAKSITASAKNTYEKVRRIHNWVAENIYYDYDYLNGIKETTALSAKDVISYKHTVCDGYANLTVALMRSAGIPCIKIGGYALGVSTQGEWSTSVISTSQINHAWNEAYVDGRWIIFDTTWDSGNRYENGKFNKGYLRSDYFDITDEALAKTHFIIRRESTVRESAYQTEGNFKYYIENNGATIVGWSNKNSNDLTIPNRLGGLPVLAIADNVFENAYIDSLTLPDTLEKIGYQAFYAATYHGKVKIPASVTQIGMYAFSYMFGVKAFEVHPDNISFCSIDGTLFDKSVNVLINYPIGNSRVFYKVPDTVEYLSCTSFGNAFHLKRLAVENMATSYATYTFFGCDMTIYARNGSKIQAAVLDPTRSDSLLFSDISNFKSESFDNFVVVNDYSAPPFWDISNDRWYYENVKSAYRLGLMVGDTFKFNPEGKVSIAEAITMAARLHSIYFRGTQDIGSSNVWYKVYVDYAKKNGIVTRAYANYNAPATRSELAEIFANAMSDEALKAVKNVSNNSIPDVSITDSFGPAVYKLYRAGVLSGVNGRAFKPYDTISRAEAAAIMTRMANPSLRK